MKMAVHQSANTEAPSTNVELPQTEKALREALGKLIQENALLKLRVVELSHGSQADRELRHAALNLMEDALQSRETAAAANASLRAAEARLEQTVTERTEQLRESISELEAFSYSIAHDLRAPLRSMQSFAQVLSEQYSATLDCTGQDYVRRIARSAERMDRLVQDVLNYSKIIRGSFPMERVDIQGLLSDIIESYPNLSQDNATVVLEDGLPIVRGNRASLVQCFSNILGNAVKFVSPGTKPQIRVWAERHDSSIRILIKDNGIGIAPDQHDKIFSIFEQVNKNYSGTGIGLAIVKKAVERMGGKVGLISSLETGSTFWIELKEETK